MTSGTVKSTCCCLLAAIFSTSLVCSLVSFTTALMLFSVAGILTIGVPLVLLNVMKLSQYSSEKTRRFLEKVRRGPIAHRGGKPENTLAAFSKAKSEGAFGVEVDLSLTKDGHAVLLHDATVDRTSNGTGRIDKMTLKQVKKLDFGSHSGLQFEDERIPTLKEAVALCKELDLVMFLEVKSIIDVERAIKVITELYSENPEMYDMVAVVSFFPHILYKLRSADPDILCGFTFVMDFVVLHPDGVYKGKAKWQYLLSPIADAILMWSLETWILKLLGVKLLLPNKDFILRREVDVKKLEEKGMCVIPWTVNKKEEKDHFRDLKLPYFTDMVSSDHEDQFQS